MNGCDGNPLIRSIAAIALPGGGEVVYAGTYGPADGGASRAGHVLSITMSAGGVWSAWSDLTLNPVTNDSMPMNLYGFDISSLYIDAHDPSGDTVYATVEGFPSELQDVSVAYRSTDGGAHWTAIASNLPQAPANSVVVDPQDSNTLYVATDVGVYSTRKISMCGTLAGNCWVAFGTGLPGAPVVQLSAAPSSASLNVPVAGTYGRGIWQIPLLTAGTQLTTATLLPSALTFSAQAIGSAGGPQVVTLTNNGGVALLPTTVNASGDFNETDTCAGTVLNAGATCSIEVLFAPTQTGVRSGGLTVAANIPGGQLSIPMIGTGIPAGLIALAPATINFGQVEIGTTSQPLQVTMENGGNSTLAIASVSVSSPFALVTNVCFPSLAANTDCQLTIQFAPTAAGLQNGTLTVVDAAGTQTVHSLEWAERCRPTRSVPHRFRFRARRWEASQVRRRSR
jgi:hypothetical protein